MNLTRLFLGLLAGIPSLTWGGETTSPFAILENAPCPNKSDVQLLTKAQQAITHMLTSDAQYRSVLDWLDRCYQNKNKVPACLRRAYDHTEYLIVTNSNFNAVTVENELDMRRPPKELLAIDPSSNETLIRLFQTNPYKDAEQIAKENGWPVVRYKSRHSGGFDSNTPSLLMIRVPGNKRTPPVDYDQYINIPLPADADDEGPLVNPVPQGKIPGPEEYNSPYAHKMPSTTTLLTVKKGKGGVPSRIFFTSYSRRGQFWRASPITNLVQSCYGCHPNGMRAISPLGFGISAEQHASGQVMADELWKAVREMNGSMSVVQNHSMPSWGEVRDDKGQLRPLLNPNGIGPVYGPVRPLQRKVIPKPDGTREIVYPTRTKEFILGDGGQAGCAKSQTSIELRDIFGRAPGRDNSYKMNSNLPLDWQKVKKAMNCASCHDNKVHAALNSYTNFNTIAYKILVDRSMPLWAHRNPLDKNSSSERATVSDELNSNERIALVNCLREEFQTSEMPRRKEWLSETSCSRGASRDRRELSPDDSGESGQPGATTAQ